MNPTPRGPRPVHTQIILPVIKRSMQMIFSYNKDNKDKCGLSISLSLSKSQRSSCHNSILSLRPNRAKSIAGWAHGEFCIKSGKNRAAAARTSTPEVLILYSSGGGPSILTQLNFAGRSADVPTIHSLFGHLAVSARRPKGHRRNYLLCRPNGQCQDAIRTPVGDRSIICRFAPSNCWLLRDRWVIERCPCDHPAVIQGVSLECAVPVYCVVICIICL